MASKITPEQRADLQAHVGHPVPVEDDMGNVVCYMIGADIFNDEDSEYNQRIQELITEGDNAPDVEADVAHARMQRTIQKHATKLA